MDYYELIQKCKENDVSRNMTSQKNYKTVCPMKRQIRFNLEEPIGYAAQPRLIRHFVVCICMYMPAD